MAEKVQIVLSAVDQTSAAFSSIKSGLGEVQSRAMTLQGALAALGFALPTVALGSMIKTSIDAADHLGKLSQRTGIAVQDLAGLEHAAKLSDMSLDGLAGGIKKLSVYLTEAQTGGKEQAATLKALGVTARDPKEALYQLADQFARLPDGATKTAMAVKLLGKSGDEMIPLLNGGSAALRGMIEEGQRLNPVTAETARLAEQFNDNMTRLGASMRTFSVVLGGELLPVFNEYMEQLLKGKEIAGGFANALLMFGTMNPFKTTGAQVESLRADLEELQAARERYVASHADTAAIDESIAAIKKKLEFAKLLQRQEALAGAQQYADYEGRERRAKAAQSAEEARLRAMLDGKKEEKTAREKLAESIDKELSGLRNQAVFYGIAAEQVKVYELAMRGATQAQVEEAQGWADRIAMLREEKQRLKDALESGPDAAAFYQRQETLKGAVDRIGKEGASETERLKQKYDEENAILAEARQRDLLTEEQYQEMLKEIQDRYNAAKAASEKRFQTWNLASAKFFFDSLGILMTTHHRGAFELGKAASIGSTIIDTYESAQAAFKALAGIPIVGPALGTAAAAAAIAGGMARVQAIKSTQFGGGALGSGVATGVFSASPVTGLPTNTISPGYSPVAAQQASAPPREINITLHGTELFTADMIRDQLIPALNDAIGDGVKLNVAVN